MHHPRAWNLDRLPDVLHRRIPVAAGVALACAMAAGARALAPEPPDPALLVLQPDGLPAAGVALWCGRLDPLAPRTHRSRDTDGWIRGVSDASGQLRFSGDPEECHLRGDGVAVLGDPEVSLVSGTARVTVLPSFRCESALVAVGRDADWLLAWYRPGKGFRGLRIAAPPALAESARQLWLEEGEHRDPHDKTRDCALVVENAGAAEASSKLGALTRPIRIGRSDSAGQFHAREVPHPAFDVRVWTVAALCAWVERPLPPELAVALPDDWACGPKR